jgi:hypothetical protein
MCDFDDENDAAAAPATTMANTNTRKASFIIGYPLKEPIDKEGSPLTLKIVVQVLN